MKYLFISIFLPLSLIGMQKQTTSSQTKDEKAELKNKAIHEQTTIFIEQTIKEDDRTDWPKFFKNIDNVATPQQQEEYKQKLLQKVQPSLFHLANRFEHPQLQSNAEFNSTNSTDAGKKIINKGASTVITMPEGVPNRIALNPNGNTVAINYGNTVQVISQKNHGEIDTYNKEMRYPIQSLAFSSPQIAAFTKEYALCGLDVKTKILGTNSNPSFGKSILISPDGTHLWYESINPEGASLDMCLKNLKTEAVAHFKSPKQQGIRGHFNKFAASSKGDFVAATESQLIFGSIKNDKGNLLIINQKAKEDPFIITDCDIHPEGNRIVAIGDHDYRLFLNVNSEKTTFDLQQGGFEEKLKLCSVRFHPTDNSIILASNNGILICDMQAAAYKKIGLPALRALALSHDGDTIAATGDDAVFILSRKELKKSLSIQELMLIKRLATETSTNVFAATRFIEIFKNIQNNALKQRLVKVFQLNYQMLGYDECAICKDNFADQILHETQIADKHICHTFCSDCIEQLPETNDAKTCPLCRAEIK